MLNFIKNHRVFEVFLQPQRRQHRRPKRSVGRPVQCVFCIARLCLALLKVAMLIHLAKFAAFKGESDFVCHDFIAFFDNECIWIGLPYQM